nr:hypothetical protein [Tanacetum cinerariifolium]
MMLRLVLDQREDLCLITSFRFGKVNLDPKEEDHSKFRKRVFPKIGNLKGEHLLTLVNKDVKFNKLDDGMLYVFVNHRKYHFEKLASNPKYEANYVLCGFVFSFKIWALETFSNSIHWWRKDTNVFRVVDKEEVHVRALDKEDVRTRAVDEEDTQERVVLAKTVKAQEQMIVDLHRRLFSLEEITKQLKTGLSDVDHLDKSDNRSENVPVGGLTTSPWKGLASNWNDVLDNFHVYGLDHQSVGGGGCTRLNDEYESVAIDIIISLRSKDVGHIYKDACVSELMDVDQHSLVKNVLDDVRINSVEKDAEESDVKTVEVPLPRQKFPRSYSFSNCTKKTVSVPEGVMALFRDKNMMEMSWTFPRVEDGHVIRMDF